MGVLKKGTLKALRRVANKIALTDDAEIFRATESVDDSGAAVVSYPGTASDTGKCLVGPVDNRLPLEMVTGDKLTTISEWDVTLPAETVIKRTDRIRVTFTLFDAVTTQMFEVTRAIAPETHEVLRTAQCKIVE